MKNVKFYICPVCGNIVEMVNNAGPKPFCCGQKMQELVPGSVDASHEKHVPDVKVSEGVVEVNVGSVNHPMEEVHWIEWVQLITEGQLPEVAESRRSTQCKVPVGRRKARRSLRLL